MRKSQAAVLSIGAALALWGPSAHAAATEQDGPPLQADDNLLGSLIWVIIALLLVIGLIIIFIKFLSQRSRSYGLNRSLRTLGGVALGQNKSLQVVELAGKVYVVGVGEDISLLDKIDDPLEARQLIDKLDQQLGSGSLLSITQWKNPFRKQNQGEELSEEHWNKGTSSFEHMLQDKLQRSTERKQQMKDALDPTHFTKNQSRDE